MGEVFATARAVELPDVRPFATRRRHRPVTGTAGILLFVCMFLPALRGCGTSQVVPLELPPFLPPYLYGLVFAIAVHARTQRAVIASIFALRLLGTLVALAGFTVFLVAPAVGIVELAVGMVLIVAASGRGFSEHRMALTAVILGCVCTLWFGMWCLLPSALLGVHLSLASSIALLVGGVVWHLDIVRYPRSRLPVAARVSSHHEGFDHLRPGVVRRV